MHNPSRMHIITFVVHVADWLGLPRRLLLSIAFGESEFDLQALGDNGTSGGLFQGHAPAHGGSAQDYMGMAGARRIVDIMHRQWVAQYNPRAPFWQNWSNMQGADSAYTKANEQRALAGGEQGFNEYTMQPPSIPVPHHVTLPFGIKDGRFYGTAVRPHAHRGVDFGCPHGSAVRVVTPGTVIRAGWLGGYGNAVTIEDAQGNIHIYAHLENALSTVLPGNHINRGAVLGLSGASGDVSGPHLHYEVNDPDGNPIDPIPFLLNEVVGPRAFVTARVAAPDGLNLRAGPDRASLDLGDLLYGQEVRVYDRDYQGTGFAEVDGGFAASWWLDYAPASPPPPPPADCEALKAKLREALNRLHGKASFAIQSAEVTNTMVRESEQQDIDYANQELAALDAN